MRSRFTFTVITFLSIGLLAFAGACGGGSNSGSSSSDAEASDTSQAKDTNLEPDTKVPPEDTGPTPSCSKGSDCFNGNCCTCSPPKNCEAGIDNMLSGIAPLANGPLQGSVADGSVNIIAELSGDYADGKTFSLKMYTSSLHEDNAECDVNTEDCNFIISMSSFNEDCSTMISFDNAVINGTTLTAGGADGLFQLSLPITDEIVLALVVTRAQLVAEVEMEGDTIKSITGILAGAVPKKALEQAIDAIDEESLPISKDAIKNILANVVKEDIDALDADGNPGSDGTPDSSSVAIKLMATPVSITGYNLVTPSETEPPEPACTEPPAIDTLGPVFRVSSLQLGESGMIGDALDIDGICAAPDTEKKEWCPASGE
jgi:hypothetical protein